MSKIIEDFCTAFATDIESWEFWKGEHNSSNKLIIAGPSRIVGLVDLKKLPKIEWESYSIESPPTKKMKGNFVFEGGMYSMDFLKKIFHFLSDPFEVARVRTAILFKLTESVALGLAEKITNEDFYYDDKGVMFVEGEFEELDKKWKTVTTAKEFVNWIDGVAKRKHSGKVNVWYEEVYRFEKFFMEELDDMGDMMLI